MTAPRMTAKARADRRPVESLFRTPNTHPLGNGWKTAPLCAIVGPCLTGAHTTPETEPPEYMTHDKAPE